MNVRLQPHKFKMGEVKNGIFHIKLIDKCGMHVNGISSYTTQFMNDDYFIYYSESMIKLMEEVIKGYHYEDGFYTKKGEE